MGNRPERLLPAFALLTLVAWGLAPATAEADKKADEERKRINPPVPYALFVAASPNRTGAERILRIFDDKNARKKRRQHYDTWFRLVSNRDEAEIVIEVADSGRDEKPGYEPVYFISGRLSIAGIVSNTPIRGDDTVRLWGDTQEEFDLLNRIVRYMREDHKEAVLAHSGTAAAPVSTAGPTAEEEDEPLYVHWARFKPGSWVARRSEGTLSGDSRETLKSVSATEVVVEIEGRTSRTETIPARRRVDRKGTPWQESEEVIEVAGKRLPCRAQKSGEMSRWYCPDVPGGFARFEWKKDGKFVQRVWATAWEARP